MRTFVQVLHALSHSGVVLGVRADFYQHCLDHPELAEAPQNRSMALCPMSVSELRHRLSAGQPSSLRKLRSCSGTPEGT